MGKLTVKEIRLLNFKGFAKLCIPLSSKGVVILGSKNGYGKTTLFDALELLFTGKIQRMTEYNEYHNNRYAISQEEKPLVYNKSFSDLVIVSAEIEVGNKQFILQREANVKDMKNPVDFKAFSQLQIVEVDGTNRNNRVLTDEEYEQLGIAEFCQSYSFLNYLSQEEATTFLKQKEADRAEMLSQLFDLEKNETYLRKIKKVQDSLGGLRKQWKDKQTSISIHIKHLKSSLTGEYETKAEYFQITKELKDHKWDTESPKLSFEEFNSFLEENGILDNLSYLAKHMADFKKYNRKLFINQHSDKDELAKLAFCAKYSSMEHEISLFWEFHKKMIQPLSSLMLADIDRFTLYIPNEIRIYVADEIFENIANRLKTLKEYYKSFDNIQKAQSNIFAMRNKLANAVKSSVYKTQQCPLCGQDYTASELLLRKIDEQGVLLDTQMQDALNNIQKQFDNIKNELQERIIEPIVKHFADMAITLDVCEQYKQLDIPQLSRTLKKINEQLKISVDGSFKVDVIADNLRAQLENAILEYDETLNYKLMTQIYSSFGRYISKDMLTEENIQQKRIYLTEVWTKSKSEQLKVYEHRQEYAKAMLNNIERRIAKFKSMQKDVQDSEKRHLRKLLSDIKILFYIYSGRIMQDNYFGRGLFIREDLDRKRVLITSSKNINDEVDALFSMSSGQLVSIMVALTLSLNKLYSSVPFLAIDDPIQTMDDINLWGLMETLRHDFSDHFLLLSTHETDYGKLLEYKLKKWGIDTEFVEMSQLHKKQC